MAILSLSRIAARSFVSPLALATVLLAGCSDGRGRYPSLAVRPAERAFGSASPVIPAPATSAEAPPAISGSVKDRVEALKIQAYDADRAFVAARGEATRLAGAARGATPGSEAWSVAQIALARLDSARSQGMIAMADLDRMLVVAAQAAAEGPATDLELVRAAHGEVSAMIADEDSVIATLRAQVAG